MKKINIKLICTLLLAFSTIMLCNGQSEVRIQKKTLNSKEIAHVISTNESKEFGQQIAKNGFRKTKVNTAEKYFGVDSIGAFEIILIEEKFVKGKAELNSVNFQAKRSNKLVYSKVFGYDEEKEYQVGKAGLEVIESSASPHRKNDFTTCFAGTISNFSQCKEFTNSLTSCIKNCPKNPKGRPKLGSILGCIFYTGSAGITCVKNVVGLASCIVNSFSK